MLEKLQCLKNRWLANAFRCRFRLFLRRRRRRRHRRRRRLVKRIDRWERATLHEGNAPGIHHALAVKRCDYTFAAPANTFAHKSRSKKRNPSSPWNVGFRTSRYKKMYLASNKKEEFILPNVVLDIHNI